MTAKEVRGFRSVCKKLVEVEEKTKMLEELKKRKICLNEEEKFIHSLHSKFKVLGDRKMDKNKQHDDMVSLTLKYKIRDNILHGIKIR